MHSTDDQLFAYHQNGLSSEQRQQLADHLAGCDACQQRLKQLEAEELRLQMAAQRPRVSVETLAALRSRSQHAISRRETMNTINKTGLRLAGVLGIVIAIFGVLFFYQRNNETAPEPPVIAEPSPTPTAAPAVMTDERILIRLAVSRSELAAYEAIIEEFEMQHADIDVQLVSLEDIEVSEEENRARAIASSADVIPALANREANPQFLLDLSPFIESDTNFNRADFLPNALVADGTKIHTIPTQVGYQLIYYDKAAFDVAGVPYPETDRTLNDFLTIAQQLTKRDGDTVTRWGYVPASVRSNPLLEVQLDAPVGQQSNPRFDAPDVVAAVEWLAALATKQEVMPKLESYGVLPTEVRTLIDNQQAAMWNGSMLFYDNYARADGTLGVVNAPSAENENGVATAPFISGYGISTGSQAPQAAWPLINYLSNQRLDSSIAQLTMPARRSLIEATNYYESVPSEFATTLRYVADSAGEPHLWQSGTADVLAEAVAALVNEGASPKTTLTNSTPVEPVDEEPLTIAPPAVEEENNLTIRFVSGFNAIDQIHQRLAKEFNQSSHLTQRSRQQLSIFKQPHSLCAGTPIW